MTPQRLPGFPGRAWAAQKEALGTPSLEPGGTGAQRRPAAGTGPDAPPLCALILHGEAARPCSGKSPLLATPRALCLLPSVGRPRGSFTRERGPRRGSGNTDISAPLHDSPRLVAAEGAQRARPLSRRQPGADQRPGPAAPLGSPRTLAPPARPPRPPPPCRVRILTWSLEAGPPSSVDPDALVESQV